MEWSGVEWSGVEWSGVEWRGVQSRWGGRASQAGQAGQAGRQNIQAVGWFKPLERPRRPDPMHLTRFDLLCTLINSQCLVSNSLECACSRPPVPLRVIPPSGAAGAAAAAAAALAALVGAAPAAHAKGVFPIPPLPFFGIPRLNACGGPPPEARSAVVRARQEAHVDTARPVHVVAAWICPNPLEELRVTVLERIHP